MRVLVDADGCPVVDITVSLCRQYQVQCLLLCDTAHSMQRDGAQTFVFDKGADSVDFAIAQRACPGDVVVTQDYGLASMCLAKKARVLHQDGWEYSAGNIDALLLMRHETRKFRAAGHRTKGPHKRTQKQNDAFLRALEALLQQTVQG